MKRFVLFGIVGLSGVVVAGCPIYANDGPECYDSWDCPSGQSCSSTGYCYSPSTPVQPPSTGTAGTGRMVVDASVPRTVPVDAGVEASAPTQEVTPTPSTTPEASVAPVLDATPVLDAPVALDSGNEPKPVEAAATVYCGNPSECRSGETCGVDGICHSGDCARNACINQFVCTTTDQGLACLPGDPAACAADSQCAAGKACIDGRCSPVANLCSDQTQCPGGFVCVEGKCTESCGADSQCAAGFRCHTSLKICDVAAKDCAKTSDCGGPNEVCIGNACVPRCSALGVCEDGSGVCVNNGCVPAQKATQECDGEADAGVGCGAGKICLNHHCYVSCDAPNETACGSLPKFTICKTLTTSTGKHAVCGSAQNLGDECDPTRAIACAPGKLCIDGFCR